MQDRPKSHVSETNESNLLKWRVFMLGNGHPVLPSQSQHFCETARKSALDEDNACFKWFKRGMATAAEMIAYGVMDFKTSSESNKPRTLLAKSSLPKWCMFVLGNGCPVSPSQSRHFCETTISGVLDENNICEAYAKIGKAVMVEAIARGTMDFEIEPEIIIHQAWHDIHNISNKPNKLTDVMKVV